MLRRQKGFYHVAMQFLGYFVLLLWCCLAITKEFMVVVYWPESMGPTSKFLSYSGP